MVYNHFNNWNATLIIWLFIIQWTDYCICLGLNSNTSKEVSKRANEEQSQFESIEAKLIVKDVEQRTSKLGNVDEYEEPKEENETNNNKPKDYSE